VLVSRSLRTPCRGHGRRRRGRLLGSTHPKQASRPAVQGGPTNEEVERDSCERLCPEHVGARSSVRAHERLTGAGLAVARHTVVPDRTPEARRSSAAVHASASPRARVVSRLMAVERAGFSRDDSGSCGCRTSLRPEESEANSRIALDGGDAFDARDRPRHAPAGVPDGRTGASRRRRPLLLPLGAGGHSVRVNGKVFEAVAAFLGGRARCDSIPVRRESPRLRSCGSAPR
jgi:hypothetical protein